MRKIIYGVLLIAFCLPLASQAAIYKWRDKQGNVHFTDQPRDGAEKVNIPEAQTFTPPPIQKPQPTSQDKTVAPRSYKSITINQPENDATIRNNQGLVAVSVSLDPALMKGDRVVLVYDGQKVGEPQATTSFSLDGVYRGTHTVSVQIVDSAGKVIGESSEVTFHMHRPRVGMGGR